MPVHCGNPVDFDRVRTGLLASPDWIFQYYYAA
jgi:hypothetical protein